MICEFGHKNKASKNFCETCRKKYWAKAYQQTEKRKAFLISDKYKTYLQSDKRKATTKAYRNRVKNEIFNLLGGVKCNHCGFSDQRALQIDHKNGGGTKERKGLHENPKAFYRLISKNPNNYQILCANCNWIKRFEKGEHG